MAIWCRVQPLRCTLQPCEAGAPARRLAAGGSPSEPAAARLQERAGPEGSGRGEDMALGWRRSRGDEAARTERLRQVFDSLDANRNGWIEVDEIQASLLQGCMATRSTTSMRWQAGKQLWSAGAELACVGKKRCAAPAAPHCSQFPLPLPSIFWPPHCLKLPAALPASPGGAAAGGAALLQALPPGPPEAVREPRAGRRSAHLVRQLQAVGAASSFWVLCLAAQQPCLLAWLQRPCLLARLQRFLGLSPAGASGPGAFRRSQPLTRAAVRAPAGGRGSAP